MCSHVTSPLVRRTPLLYQVYVHTESILGKNFLVYRYHVNIQLKDLFWVAPSWCLLTKLGCLAPKLNEMFLLMTNRHS